MTAESGVLSTLKSARLLSSLRPEILAALASAPKVRLEKGEELFAAGAAAKAVYVVLSGEIRLVIDDPDGRSINVESERPGGIFGELGVLDGKPRSVAARAGEETVVLSIAANQFLRIIRTEPDFALEIIRYLARKVRRTNETLSGVKFLNLKARIAIAIAGLERQTDAGDGDIAITQGELATRIGASREKVNAHLRAMHRAGVIRLARGRIAVLDRKALQIIAAGEDQDTGS